MPMASRDNDPALPPLIDFDAAALAPISESGAFTNASTTSPFQDPFSDLHLPSLSPPASSSVSFHTDQWDVLHSATGNSPNPFFDDHWVVQQQIPLASNEAGFILNSNSDNSLTNKIYNSGFNQHSFEVDDLLSDISTSSVSYPTTEFLSKVLPPTPESRLSADISAASPQTPVHDAMSLWGFDSASFHTPPINESTSLETDMDSIYSSSGTSRPSFVDSPANTSRGGLNSIVDSFSNMSLHGNGLEDFSQGSFFQTVKASGSTSFTNGKVNNLPDDISLMMDYGCSKQKVEGESLSCHTRIDEHTHAVLEGQSWLLDEKQDGVPASQAGVYPQKEYGTSHSDIGTPLRVPSISGECSSLSDYKVDAITEFIASGGGKGPYKAPERGAERPVAFELRPQPLKEQSNQTARVLACMDATLWSACDEGVMVWDIPSAWTSKCHGKENLRGDEDAAAYSFLGPHAGPLTCLFADAARKIMWSGHKDGKVTAWAISSEHDGECDGSSPVIFSWQAHQTPILSIVVTSYGELWTGSDNGSLRAWPSTELSRAFKSWRESRRIAAVPADISYIDLRSKAGASGISGLLNVDTRFLIAEHSQGYVWSGGSYVFAIWDARTRDVLKVIGSNADAEFTSPNISPIREIGEARTYFSKVTKKEKSTGTLNFFQRSRNAVMGAADAVLRAAVGVQSGDDSKKIEAVVAADDGNVWIGYASGRLVQFDSFGNRLAEFRHNSTAIRCICTFGNKIFVGYADGIIHSLAGDSGNLLRTWHAHKTSVAKIAVCGNHLFTLADNGAIRGWFVAWTDTFDTSLHSKMISKESTYVREESIKILAGTWNVGQEKASNKSLMQWLGEGAVKVNVVVVGLQEIEMGAGALAMAAAKETVGLVGSVNGQWWLDTIGSALNCNKEFVRVGSRQLAGLLIGAWVSKELLPYVGGVDVAAVACGFGRAFGNKGAVGIKMMIFRRSVCVVNGHFAAHMDAVVKRNADFDHIYQRMTFGRLYGGVGLAATAMAASAVQIIRGNSVTRQDTASVEVQDVIMDKGDEVEETHTMPDLSEADLLIWVGDFNYRLTDLSYEDTVNFIYDKEWDYLLGRDQLRSEMKAGRVFQGMREASIAFPPTYKFDKGAMSSTPGYDSSEKRRVPAWCDRVLYRDSFDKMEAEREISLSRPVAAAATRYGAHETVNESDHKPVSCYFDVHIAVINEAARRWEYGRFLRTNSEAIKLQKEIEIVPETHINTTNIQLLDKFVSIINITNDSTEDCALFRFYSEARNCGTSEWGNALPYWLQVIPASGVLQPGQSLEVKLQHAGIEIFENDPNSQQGFTIIKQGRETGLVLEVKGMLSSSSKQHLIRVSQSFSKAFQLEYSSYIERQEFL